MKTIMLPRYVADNNDTEAQRWLCRALMRQGLTQSELAGRLHMTRQSVSKLFNDRTKLTFEKICAICYVCHLPDDPEEVWNQINTKEH